MRINFVLPDANLGGGTRVIAIYAERLKRRGHEVFVSSTPPHPHPRPRQIIKSLVRGRGWPRVPRRVPSHFDGVDVEHHIRARRGPLTDRDLPDGDVVIATWWETAEWIVPLSPSKGVKSYFIQQYETNFGMPRDRVDATWRMPFRKIVCSRYLADLARDHFDDPGAVISPNGIDLDQFHAPERGKQMRPTVGVLYQVAHAKGWDVCLAALADIARRIPGLRVRAYGAHEPTAGLPLPPGTDYTLLPPQDRLRDIYAECDLWLCASRSEGFHLPPHEAMACRCPVVSTRVGGPMDIIEEGVNGYLVDVEDYRSLADRAVDVLGLPGPDWKRMSDAALATAESFSWDDATDIFESALLAIAEGAEEHGPRVVGRAGHSG
jgi:glycosyltransferase involved in cell wall biosynthesis